MILITSANVFAFGRCLKQGEPVELLPAEESALILRGHATPVPPAEPAPPGNRTRTRARPHAEE